MTPRAMVIDSLIDEIGEERMRDVLAAADAEAIAFPGAPKRETQTLITDFRDWRYLLDLLEEVGGSTQAADLFETWVAADTELPLLADHEAAHRRYDALVEDAQGWMPAYALRSQMARWAFDARGSRARARPGRPRPASRDRAAGGDAGSR